MKKDFPNDVAEMLSVLQHTIPLYYDIASDERLMLINETTNEVGSTLTKYKLTQVEVMLVLLAIITQMGDDYGEIKRKIKNGENIWKQ